jgi:mono/diheme cytochrome c family protein
MTQPNPAPSSPPLIPALLLFGGMTLLLMALFSAHPSQKPGSVLPTLASDVTEAPTSAPIEVTAVTAALDPAKVSAGETIFQTTCIACHGFNAMGISGLGKTLIGSPFVNDQTDDQLLAFLHIGRDVIDPLNTTGVMMPPKGGNPALDDDDLLNVIAYIRSLNSPAGTVAVAPTVVPVQTGPTATPYVFVPLPLSAGNTVEITPEVEVTSMFGSVGEALYIQSCSGCHGIDGSGVPYVAQSLAESQLLSDQDGIGLLTFLTNAQPPVNPETAYPHPYRGGYPELTDDQLRDVIGYMYTLTP